ncbi:MAG: DUF3795 domain-containing protein [bacterium]
MVIREMSRDYQPSTGSRPDPGRVRALDIGAPAVYTYWCHVSVSPPDGLPMRNDELSRLKRRPKRAKRPVAPNGCCGIDCGGCGLRRAEENPELQRQFAQWFQVNLKLTVAPEKVRCSGCRGRREEHWNPDCWILKCCADDHGRRSCADCPEFPCRHLRDWAAQCQHFTAAFDWLCARRAARQL